MDADGAAHAKQELKSVPRARRLLPLLLASMAAQALLVVLTPTIVEVGRDLGVSVGLVGQARSAFAAAAIVSSLVIAPFLDRLGVRPLLLWGAGLAIAGCAAAAASPSLVVFGAVHTLLGVGFACLMTAGFAGVAAFAAEDRPWAMGYLVGANGLAWVVVNPLAGALTDLLSWRAAQAVPAAIALCVIASARAAPAASATGVPGFGLLGVLARPSARRWVISEMISFFAWGAYLTFTGAFFIERHGLSESATGVLLALWAAVFFAASVRVAPLLGNLSRPLLVATSALGMGALIALQLGAPAALWIALAAAFSNAVAGGVRLTVSSTLGLSQLPDQPGSMMAARTAAIQTGYLLGGLLGGVTLAWSGYAALGLVLGAATVLSAALVLGVKDPLARKGDEGSGSPVNEPAGDKPNTSQRVRNDEHSRAGHPARERNLL